MHKPDDNNPGRSVDWELLLNDYTQFPPDMINRGTGCDAVVESFGSFATHFILVPIKNVRVTHKGHPREFIDPGSHLQLG